MNQPLPPDPNQSPSPEPGIRQQVENSTMGGGIQSIIGNNNNQIQQILNIFLASANDHLLQQYQDQSIDFTVSSFFKPPDLSIPLIVEKLSRRVETVTTLKNIYSSSTWIAIHGISGSGKTHLAVLLIQEMAMCRAWIKLRDLDIEKATQKLDKSLIAITTLAPPSNRYQWYCHICESLGNGTALVLDDLPELLGSDELSSRLIELARACSLYGVKLLSTSPYQLPFSLQELLGEQILYSTETPPLKDSEAAEILQAYGAPTSVIQTDTRFLNSLAQQHPQLVVVIAKYLRQHNWQTTGDIEERLFRGDYLSALNSQTIKRILDSIEDEDSRNLLYRLCLPIGSFSQKEVQAVASVEPPIQRAIEHLYILEGLWIQRDVNEYFLVSPLVKPLGSGNLLPETKKSCHQVLADQIVSKSTITVLDAEDAFIHYLGAENFDRAGIMLISALQEIIKIDSMVYTGTLLSFWGSLPLPLQMDLSYRIILRGLQIIVRNKYSKPINYLIDDLDTLIEQAREDNALSVIVATTAASSIIYKNDSVRANRYLRTALQFLPHAQMPDSNDFTLPDTASLGFLIWATSQGINTIEKLRDWINTVEQLTVEQRNFAFTHEAAELGCLIVSENLWLKEAEKPKEEQNWTEILEAYIDLADRASRLDLELLWGCAICSKIIILVDYQQNISAAISVAEAALKQASSEPRVQFLIKGCVGRQLVNANRNNQAVVWLSQALSEDTKAYPVAHMKVLLSMSCATGEQDSSLAVEFARQAVSLAEISDEIDDILLVKALAELSIAQWLSSDMKAVFQSLDKALERLLACKSDTDDWKILFVAFGSVTGYFTSIACTGTPPRLTKSGEPYATPERGMFFKLNSQIVADYNSNFECYVLVNLANFAEALGSDERVAFWSLKSIDEARIRKQYEVITTLYLKAIPHYLLQNSDLAKILDIALDAGVGFAALISGLQSGQLTTVIELDVESILGNKPSEMWRMAEHNAVLIGLIPIVFRIATIALHNTELAKTQATEVAAICRQISATAVDSYLWVTAAELLEQIYSQEATHDGILRYTKTFDSQNYAVLQVIGYLVATLQNDTPLASAVLDHLVIAPFVYSQPTKLTAAYRLVILPFFIEYWKDKFQSMPLLFSSPSIISQIFRQLETITEVERLQMILVAVAFNLNVRIPRNAAEWILESSPGLVAYFGM